MKHLTSRLFTLCLAFFLAGIILEKPTFAATIQVNDNSDTIDQNDGKCTLREAIAAANFNETSGPVVGECLAGDASTIDVINISDNLSTINLTSGALIVTESVNIKGPGANKLTVNGEKFINGIFKIEGLVQQQTVSIEGLTIAKNENTNAEGGAIIISPGNSLTISSSVLDNNSSVTSGGAIYNGGNLTLINCIFSSNKSGSAI